MGSALRMRTVEALKNHAGYVLVGTLLLITIMMLSQDLVKHIQDFESWVAAFGPMAFIVFVLLYVLLCSLLVPESVLGIIAGFTFGMANGLLLVVISNFLAAILQYSLASTIIRPLINQRLAKQPRLKQIQAAVLTQQLKLQMLLRLTPINRCITNYVLGAAGVKMGYFLFACVCMIPNLFLEIYFGYASKTWAKANIQSSSSLSAHEILTFAGIIIAIVVMTLITRTAQKAIASATREMAH
jgi:uncharacterized membrane protein YdjX (TVP38/TMEM64 family)